jgi:hypothetical protein
VIATDDSSNNSENQTIRELVDFLKDLSNNPSQLAISADSFNQAIELSTDDDLDNDDQFCDIIEVINLEDMQDKENLKNILNC